MKKTSIVMERISVMLQGRRMSREDIAAELGVHPQDLINVLRLMANKQALNIPEEHRIHVVDKRPYKDRAGRPKFAAVYALGRAPEEIGKSAPKPPPVSFIFHAGEQPLGIEM